MDQDQEVKINYASKYSGVANYWKNRQGMIDALTFHKTAATKAVEEAKFNKWANKAANKAKYGECPSNHSTIITQLLMKKQDTTITCTERWRFAPYIATLASKNGRRFRKDIEQAFATSIFASSEKVNAFLANPDAAAVAQDPLFLISSALMTKYREVLPGQEEAEGKFQAAYRKYIAGVLESNPKGKYYPDANSTLRLTYGSIMALPPNAKNDAAENYYTTLKGTIAKYKKGDEEFDFTASD
ncbi:hypothetical protein FQR65_LT15430 [Abscondita terminalis]|nr:hypothetical protein FQR65_LT15430 [Abscondita terminalis]